MKRGLTIITMLFLLGLSAAGKSPSRVSPRITFGCQWDYCGTFLTGLDQYFYAPEGFRESIKYNAVTYLTNGESAIHGGYNFNDNWNLSLYIGYTALGEYHRAVPVSLRATRYYGDNPLDDRWFSFIDLGSGVSIKSHPQEIFTGKIGGGYRMSLSRYAKLDFILSLRAIYTHPDLIYYNEIIQDKDISSNHGYACSISCGIGITF